MLSNKIKYVLQDVFNDLSPMVKLVDDDMKKMSELVGIENYMNSLFGKNVTKKWLTYEKFVDQYTNFETKLEEFCKTNTITLVYVDDMKENVNVIAQVYGEFDKNTDAQKKYINKMNEITKTCNLILLNKKCQIIKDNFGDVPNVLDSFKTLVLCKNKVYNDVDELMRLIINKMIKFVENDGICGINNDIIDSCEYLYSLSSVKYKYVDVMFVLLKRCCNALLKYRSCHGDIENNPFGHTCINTLYYAKKTQVIHNAKNKIRLKLLLNFAINDIREAYFNSIKTHNFIDYAYYKMDYIEDKPDYAKVIERLINTYTRFSNETTECKTQKVTIPTKSISESDSDVSSDDDTGSESDEPDDKQKKYTVSKFSTVKVKRS
jgi:hypothetical protein